MCTLRKTGKISEYCNDEPGCRNYLHSDCTVSLLGPEKPSKNPLFLSEKQIGGHNSSLEDSVLIHCMVLHQETLEESGSVRFTFFIS